MRRKLLLLLFLLLVLAVTLGVMRSRPAGLGSLIYPEIVSFTATPRVIHSGESAVLAWVTQGAAAVAMEWGPELHPRGNMQRRTGLPPSGTMTVRPDENTIYILECNTDSDAGEPCTLASITVRVK